MSGPRADGRHVPEGTPRTVVDTSVWVSGFLNPLGPPAWVLDAFMDERFVPVVSGTLTQEIREVLARPRIHTRLRTSPERIAAVLARLEERSIQVSVSGELGLCRDPTDDYLLATAIEGRADYLVTRDDDLKRDLDLMRHLRERGVEVLSVAQFLELLAKRSA